MARNTMTGFTVYLLILKIAFGNGQFEKNICVGDVEIAFSTEIKTFNEARLSCQSFGGDLVKIGSAAIQTGIQNTIAVKPEYYIGAFDQNRDNIYHWLVDSTEVPKNPELPRAGLESGYQNWKANQPNIGGEKCVALGIHDVYTWSDTYCSERYRYICQRGNEQILTVSRSDTIVTCFSSLLSVPVRWEKDSVVVESSDERRVYQRTRSNNATLHFENANVIEEGNYSCVCATSLCTARKMYKVTIDRSPSILKIQNNKCNSSLHVSWRPNRAAVKFQHRIVALNTTNVTLFYIPQNSEICVTEISGLNSSTQYTIEVTACTAADLCETSFLAKSNGETNGLTDPVTTPRLAAAKNGNCVVSWDKSDEASLFTVKTRCSLHPIRSGEDVTISNKTVTTSSMIFQPLPSRRCEAFIQAKGCGEISKRVKANGVCSTSAKEPDYVHPPVLLKNPKRNVTSHVIEINKPNENNGLISCLFVIVCHEKCTNVDFTYEKLKNANETDSERNGYLIAAAIPMLRQPLLGSSCILKLSEGNTTYCDVHNVGISNSTSLSSEIFRGQNVVIMNSLNTSMFLVSTTLSDGRVLLKSSSVLTIEALKNKTEITEVNPGTEANLVSKQPTTAIAGEPIEEENSGLPLGLGIGIAGGLIAGFVAGFLVARCKTNKSRSPGQAPVENIIVMTPQPSQEQDTSFHGYENTPSGSDYEEIKPRNNSDNQETDPYEN